VTTFAPGRNGPTWDEFVEAVDREVRANDEALLRRLAWQANAWILERTFKRPVPPHTASDF